LNSNGTKLRFCMVSVFYPPYGFGGDAMFVYRLATKLVEQGHEADIIHCADSYHALSKTVDESAFPVSRGMELHRLESGLGRIAPLLSHQTGFPLLRGGKIARILQSKKFDVIHFHNISLLGPGVLGLPAAGAPVRLLTAHDHWLVCPMSVLWKNGERACDGQECIRCTLRSGRPPQWWRYSSLMERMTRRLDCIFAPSQFCADKHAEFGFQLPMEVLPYFLEPIKPSVSEPGRPHERPYFLFVGRLEPYKGVQEILPAFGGEGDYDLLIVGGGRYESELRRRAEGMKRVRFAGWKNQDDIGPYYRHALAVVVPSTTFETFALVQIEAFARETPVIVHDLGALPEVARGARGGLVYRDREELDSQLSFLSQDEEARLAMGRRGYEAYLEKWTPEAHLSAYHRAIERARRKKLQSEGT
jgi:glycosyltransferase involved in cell wall biosynthesis